MLQRRWLVRDAGSQRKLFFKYMHHCDGKHAEFVEICAKIYQPRSATLSW